MLKQFGVALLTFLTIDGIWLMLVAKNFYASQLGFLMSKTPNLPAAGLFYVIYVIALVVLIISPVIEKGTLLKAILAGALFGLAAYGTYDLTNLATIKDWPVVITLIDLLWGSTVTGLVSGITYWIFTR